MADEPTQPDGVPVVIVLAFNGEEQDRTRIGRVEYHPKSDARRMVDSGQARWVDDPRNADDRWPIEDEEADGAKVEGANAPAAEPKPLADMSKTELRGVIPGGDELPDTTTRLELLAMARAAQQPEPVAEPTPDTP